MKNRFSSLIIACLYLLLLAACTSPASAPLPTAAPIPTGTPLPATATTVPPTPTDTPLPSPTATPVLYPPPAARYLPQAGDLGKDYSLNTNLLASNVSMLAQLPLPKENIAMLSFAFSGSHDITRPQDGMYYSQDFWVAVAPDETAAAFLYDLSQSAEYRAQAFLVIMPGSVQAQMGPITAVPAGKTPCDQVSISAVASDPYASYRSGVIPTLDPVMANGLRGFPAEKLALLPPDLYLYASCRIKNVLVLYWGYAPNNDDGKNGPIPPDVIAQQVSEHLRIVSAKLK